MTQEILKFITLCVLGIAIIICIIASTRRLLIDYNIYIIILCIMMMYTIISIVGYGFHIIIYLFIIFLNVLSISSSISLIESMRELNNISPEIFDDYIAKKRVKLDKLYKDIDTVITKIKNNNNSYFNY